MYYKLFLKNMSTILMRLLKYNIKIIFGNKFIYFILGASVVFIIVTAVNLFYIKASPDEETIFWNLLIPGILVIFYPVTFGIQNDLDNRMLEIVFGIPNYRFKVQLLRLLIIFLLAFCFLLFFTIINDVFISGISVFSMLYQLMFPIIFLGSIAFLISTFIKDGSGTAIIMLIIGVIFWIAKDFFLNHPRWNIFLNPFALPENLNETIWAETVTKNRVYLLIASILTIPYGLLNLQQRERLLE